MAVSSLFNRVMFNAASTGLADFIVGPSVPGYSTPAQRGIPDGTIVSYTAQSLDLSQWETGQGTYTAATQKISRTTIRESSSGNVKISFGNQPIVWVDVHAQDLGGGITEPPGDLLAAAGTPPVAAHGMVRKLFAAYSGPLFQVRRTSDNATQDIYAASDGWADMASLFSFLGTSGGAVAKLYDQSGQGNTFNQIATANQPLLLIKYLPNARPIPTAHSSVGKYLRLRTGTTGIPTGASPITVTAVFCPDDTYEPMGTIGFYGDMEATVVNAGNGHMFALAWGTTGGWNGGVPYGPWIGTDWENGIFAGLTISSNTTAPVQFADFIFALSKTNGTSVWTLKGGPAASPNLETLYSGGLPTGYTANFEGGISMGEGGDGSASPIVFIEGMICSSVSSDTADQAIQANLAQAFSGTWQQYPDSLRTGSPVCINQYLAFSIDVAPDCLISRYNPGVIAFSSSTLLAGDGTLVAAKYDWQNNWYSNSPGANQWELVNGSTNQIDYGVTTSGRWTFRSTSDVFSFVSANTTGATYEFHNTSAGGHDLFLGTLGAAGGLGLTAGQTFFFDATTGNIPQWWDASGNQTFFGVIGWTTQSGTFTAGAPDVGFSRTGAAALALGNGTQGNISGALSLASLTAGNQIDMPNGSVNAAGAPAVFFAANANTGFAANSSNFCIWESGRIALNLSTSITQFRVPADFSFSWSSATNNNSAEDTALFRMSAGVVGVNSLTLNSSGILTCGNGSVSSGPPGFCFAGATTTGLASDGSNFAFWNAGTVAWNIAGAMLRAPSNFAYGWASSTANNTAADAGLSRTAAATVAVGNGTPGDTSGFLKAKLQTTANATTGLAPGALAATTNADIVLYDGSGQAYRVPCII